MGDKPPLLPSPNAKWPHPSLTPLHCTCARINKQAGRGGSRERQGPQVARRHSSVRLRPPRRLLPVPSPPHRPRQSRRSGRPAQGQVCGPAVSPPFPFNLNEQCSCDGLQCYLLCLISSARLLLQWPSCHHVQPPPSPVREPNNNASTSMITAAGTLATAAAPPTKATSSAAATAVS